MHNEITGEEGTDPIAIRIQPQTSRRADEVDEARQFGHLEAGSSAPPSERREVEQYLDGVQNQ
jgi:hypothetical protein